MRLMDICLVMDEKENIFVYDNVEQKQHEYIIENIPWEVMNKEVTKLCVCDSESIWVEVE